MQPQPTATWTVEFTGSRTEVQDRLVSDPRFNQPPASRARDFVVGYLDELAADAAPGIYVGINLPAGEEQYPYCKLEIRTGDLADLR